ncbi:MAG TPA: DsrE family protein [Rhodospirillaceae bacterium]|nr:DsrE family protein [Rhodospirillaceae bacterium]
MTVVKPPVTLVVLAGRYDRVHYALAMAAAALAINQPVTLFFTMGGVRALLADDEGGPGWRHLLAGEEGQPPLLADQALRQKGVGGFEELLEAVVGLGGKVMVCEMGLRAMGLAVTQLRPDVPVVPGGLVSLLTDCGTPNGLCVI